MFSDYHNELSAILRTLQWQAELVAKCGEKDYLSRRERDIVYALVMEEIDSLIEPTGNLASPSGLIEPVGKTRDGITAKAATCRLCDCVAPLRKE